MGDPGLSVVTGAFGYTGKYIAQRLLDRGETVRCLTRNPTSFSPFGDRVERHPLDFDDIGQLIRSLEGADTLYNTFWIRFSRGTVDHDLAVRNTRTLVDAARNSGVRRIVPSAHGASSASSLTYFGRSCRGLHCATGPCFSVIPALLFGMETYSLTTSLSETVRCSLVAGRWRLPGQPVYVDTVGPTRLEDLIAERPVAYDAVVPRSTLQELVQQIRSTTAEASWLSLPPPLGARIGSDDGNGGARLVLTPRKSTAIRVTLSRKTTHGRKRLTDWMRDHRDTLGRHYASELARHYR